MAKRAKISYDLFKKKFSDLYSLYSTMESNIKKLLQAESQIILKPLKGIVSWDCSYPLASLDLKEAVMLRLNNIKPSVDLVLIIINSGGQISFGEEVYMPADIKIQFVKGSVSIYRFCSDGTNIYLLDVTPDMKNSITQKIS